MNSLEKLKPVALLLLRCALGAIFMARGYPKLFTQTAQAMQFFQHVGFPTCAVYGIGVLEVFGGAMLIVGLGTRVVGLLLAGEMAVAIWKVKMTHGIYGLRDYELELTLATAAFTLASLGAGLFSLDHPLFGSRPKARRKTNKE